MSWIRRAIILGAGLALLSSSVWTIQQDESGLVHRFGRVVRTVGPGFHLTLPWPAEHIEKLKTAVSRSMPVGFTYLEQLGAENADPSRREWLTGDTNIVKMEVTLNYTITDPLQHLYGMSDLSSGLSRDLVLRRLAEAAMTESIASMGIDEALSTGKTQLRKDVLGRVQRQAESFQLGITLNSFNLTEVAPPPEAQNSFNEVTSAQSYRDQQLSEAAGARATPLPFARAEADRIVQQAQTAATETTAKAQGWSKAFGELATSLQRHREIGMQRIWLQSVEQILSRAELTILPRLPEGKTAPLYLPNK
ncbi:MAG: protease modulator HflK [Planctomycetes bacterium]|nr:protease modulator HflK [Planctomycetota bacterium]